MLDVMLDLETLGVEPGCVVLSIGAVFFNRDGLGAEFYTVVRRASCEERGLTVNPATLLWWERQSPEARTVLKLAKSGTAKAGVAPLPKALKEFNGFLRLSHQGIPPRVWGNGADFDNPILAAAYRAAGVEPTWARFGHRCYRTAKNTLPGPKLERQGTHHNALSDAKSQAAHLVALLQKNPKVKLA